MKRIFLVAAVASFVLPTALSNLSRIQVHAQSQVTATVKPTVAPSGTSASPAPSVAGNTATVVSPTAGNGNAGTVVANGTAGSVPPVSGANAPSTQPAAPAPSGGNWFTFAMLGAAAILVFMLIRGPRKEEKKRKDMIASMKKGTRVVTIGGLIGSVVDIRDDVVVLKVDESANVKSHYLKSSISRVIADDEPVEEKKN